MGGALCTHGAYRAPHAPWAPPDSMCLAALDEAFLGVLELHRYELT